MQVPGSFSIAVELVTARGMVTAERSQALVEKARTLADDPRIDVLSITDNPGGHAMLAPDTLGTDLLSRGQEVIIHLACKDWNRNELVRYIRRENLPVRALANVYLLSRPAARAFHAGRIPGVIVTDELLELAERYGAGPDKGRAFFLDLAARQMAVARGLGFNGAYL